jgi:glyoxylase-like metal-dependent hydrolase (beta-lactamase superfamily II)
VIETPGHTPGSICLFAKNEGLLFTGDTIFAEGQVGRTDFSYSSAKDHKTSLKKIFKLLDNTIIYPGHKDSSTVKKEKEHQS